ncbi:MAG: VOC family protein [Candidatus Eremiobacteraeota bacterium]|nr:VOC family protein [Candidatus Eremiobacteraeota bacterium]
MGNPVVHFEIIGKNAEALRTFYRETFDWTIDPPVGGPNIPDYTVVHPTDNDRVGVSGGIGDPPEGYTGHVTFYIGVPDIAAKLRQIESRGGSVMMGPDQVPGGPVIGLFKDPEGHVIGLVETQ